MMADEKYKILLAEDEPQNVRLLLEASNACIYRVFVASNGKSAVEQALRYQHDSIIINWDMPEMDGMQAIERIRFEMEVIQHKPDEVTHEMEINAQSQFVRMMLIMISLQICLKYFPTRTPAS